MAINFPSSSLTIGQIFTAVTGLRYQWDGICWNQLPYLGTALPFNYFVNPTMSVSQENGNTASASALYYMADQWFSLLTQSTAITWSRVASNTPNGSANRLRAVSAFSLGGVGLTDYYTLAQRIEGSRLGSLLWGTANARPVVVRFGWKSPAGTYSMQLANGNAGLAYIANFTITGGQANTDTEQVFAIPGPTTGTWATDNTVGISFRVVFAVGTMYQGTANAWTVSSNYGTSSNTNGLATAGNTFELFDVGLYLDPDATGLAPKWRGPTEPENMMACLRYWYPARSAIGTVAAATACGRLGRIHPVSMRVSPSVNVGTVGGNVCYSWTLTTASPITSIANYSNTTNLEFDTGNSSGGLSGNACSLLPEYPGYLAVSARM
jgi:hypothetical protein